MAGAGAQGSPGAAAANGGKPRGARGTPAATPQPPTLPARTALGESALATATGDGNTAVGSSAAGLGFLNGNFNTAIGVGALSIISSGDNNVAVGFRAGEDLSSGSGNVYIGANVDSVAGESNTTRIRNI